MNRIGHICIAQMVGAIVSEPHTVADLCELCGLTEYTVRRYMRSFVAHGAAHIARWDEDRSGRRNAAAYLLGKGVNAKRPPKHKQAARLKQYRIRLKQQAMNDAIAGRLAA